MAIKHIQVRTSDVSGDDLADEDVVTVTYRDAEKRFDASKEELAALKRVNNAVSLEYRYPDGTTENVLVNRADFDKLVTPEILEKADSIRGRRSGFRPGNGS